MFEQQEVEKLVTGFFNAYMAWNKFAYDYSVSHPNTWQNNSSPPQMQYDVVIAKYCIPGKKHQGIAFGSDTHKEKLSEVKVAGANAIVHTLQTYFDDEYSQKHEYHLTKIAGEWKIDEIYYIDEYGGEKLPTL